MFRSRVARHGLCDAVWEPVASITFALARQFATYDYRSFMARLLGPGWIAFEIGYLLFVVLLLAVFGAAAGEVARSLLPVPAIAGTLALALATWLVASRGGWAVEAMFKYSRDCSYTFMPVPIPRGDKSGPIAGGSEWRCRSSGFASYLLPLQSGRSGDDPSELAYRDPARGVSRRRSGAAGELPLFSSCDDRVPSQILAHTLPADFLRAEIAIPLPNPAPDMSSARPGNTSASPPVMKRALGAWAPPCRPRTCLRPA